MESTTALFTPIVFAGPSGVGKGTLIGLLLQEYPDKVVHCISHTTKQPRSTEQDGKDYHFVTKEVFEQLAHSGFFVETAQVHGNWYGTSFDAINAVKSSCKLCLLDLNIEGCSSLRAADISAYLLFIAPPSIEVLESRLRGRKTEDEATIQIRLETAARELTFVDNSMWDEVIVNDDIDSCYDQVKAFINKRNAAFDN